MGECDMAFFSLWAICCCPDVFPHGKFNASVSLFIDVEYCR